MLTNSLFSFSIKRSNSVIPDKSGLQDWPMMVGKTSTWQLIYAHIFCGHRIYKRHWRKDLWPGQLGRPELRRIGSWRWRQPSGLLDAMTMLLALKPHLPPQHKCLSRGQVKRFNFMQLLLCSGTLAANHLFAFGSFIWVWGKCFGLVPRWAHYQWQWMCEEAQRNKVGGPSKGRNVTIHRLGAQEHVGQRQVKMFNFPYIVQLSLTSDYVKQYLPKTKRTITCF